MSLQLSSKSFENNESIPPQFTCDGININPHLEISGVPEECESLVLVVNDPDAAKGSWIHWLLWNIPANTTEIQENSVPLGAVIGTNDFNDLGWGGPCPPDGNHQYQFTLYALDSIIKLESGATFEEIDDAMLGHVIEQAEHNGYYSRQ